MAVAVLDSFALLAYFRGEKAGVSVKELLQKANQADRLVHMTEVNYAEVKYIMIRKDGLAVWEQAAEVLQGLPIEFHPATRSLADVAADYKSRWRLSLADAFAAALAKEKKAELATGDPEFKQLERELQILWITKEKR